MQKLVILGSGFVGKYLSESLKNEFEVYNTSRNPQLNINELPNPILFDLNNENTYINIPQNSIIIWNFPAEPIEKVKIFYDFILKNNIEIKIIYGSTSAYIDKSGNINENNITDENISRVSGENYLLNNGVDVLQLSGIYGGTRNPFNWLNKGLIKNSNKSVNLVHVKDICEITKKILKLNLKGQRVNVSDGVNYLWKDLWVLGTENNLVKTECPPFLDPEHKYISNKKLLKLLPNYIFKNILDL